MAQKAGTIHRTPFSHETFMVSWQLAQTPMDPDTLGVIIYLLSKPMDWMTSVTEVEKHFKIGKDRRQRIFAEAQELGHITGHPVAGPGGKWMGTAWQVWDKPVPEEQRTLRKNRLPEKPTVGKPGSLHEEEISHPEEIDIKLHSSAPAAATKPTASLEPPSKESVPSQPAEIPNDAPPAAVKHKPGAKATARAEADPRAQHPAVAAVRHLLKRYPNKVQWDLLIRIIGDHPNTRLLERCFNAWIIKNWNPENLTWATNWYVQDGPPQGYELLTPLTPEEQEENRKREVEKKFWRSIV